MPHQSAAAVTGHGFDAHAFCEGRPLILGGVPIEHDRGLAGHSDADVLTHAICDAILGAVCAGDIGRHFPDNDPRYKGAVSVELLRQVVRIAEERGGRILHVDATVIAQRPKLAPYMERMHARLKGAMPPDTLLNIKATTTEGMGFTGREEGIAALATATVALSGGV
ncbi:2-C-methyl-D-erythritol 2,4-cyclodiphosphate synthase [Candidatus Sumerlaeota bacterium]|nr:2-C-methyl-D-erythritol 2,4-cyclodiphosphate synthase [Candidatus Sumerlaeota bacterium]